VAKFFRGVTECVVFDFVEQKSIKLLKRKNPSCFRRGFLLAEIDIYGHNDLRLHYRLHPQPNQALFQTI
jgi:hypothetical protein